MSGTVAGGKQGAATNKLKYGADFYVRIGTEGGKRGNTGGYASKKVGKDGLTGQQRAEKWGAVGGAKSKRKPREK